MVNTWLVGLVSHPHFPFCMLRLLVVLRCFLIPLISKPMGLREWHANIHVNTAVSL